MTFSDLQRQGLGMRLVWGMVAGLACCAGVAPVCAMAQVPIHAPSAKQLAPPSAPVAPARAASPTRFVVVLDAAHGGEDGGAQVGSAVAEKTVTLAMSVRLRSLLTARGFSVVTTREGNVALDDLGRAQIANRAGSGGAAACVIFHATQVGSGVHLFVSSLGPTAPTRFLAWKTAQSAFVTRSLKLASVINSSVEHSAVGGSGSGSNADSGASDTGAADARTIPVVLARTSLPGLDSMACPAVALEVAPIRGADRAVVTEVTDVQYQTQIVESLAAAMMEWRTEVSGFSGASGDAGTASGGQKP